MNLCQFVLHKSNSHHKIFISKQMVKTIAICFIMNHMILNLEVTMHKIQINCEGNKKEIYIHIRSSYTCAKLSHNIDKIISVILQNKGWTMFQNAFQWHILLISSVFSKTILMVNSITSSSLCSNPVRHTKNNISCLWDYTDLKFKYEQWHTYIL